MKSQLTIPKGLSKTELWEEILRQKESIIKMFNPMLEEVEKVNKEDEERGVTRDAFHQKEFESKQNFIHDVPRQSLRIVYDWILKEYETVQRTCVRIQFEGVQYEVQVQFKKWIVDYLIQPKKKIMFDSVKLRRLLEYVSEQYDLSVKQITDHFQEVYQDCMKNRCKVKISTSSKSLCNMERVNDRCPYHGICNYDFSRRCEYRSSNGRSCGEPIYGEHARNLSVVFCKYHQDLAKYSKTCHEELSMFARIGNYIVIDETTFAISDDMTSIIGYVEMSNTGKFILVQKHKPEMDEYVVKYGLQFDFEQ